jgi:hypothetical protein
MIREVSIEQVIEEIESSTSRVISVGPITEVDGVIEQHVDGDLSVCSVES